MDNFYESALKECSFPEERGKTHTTIYWLVANKADDVTVLEKRSGCMGAATLSCGCSKKLMPIGGIGQYLEEQYTAGSFRKLILVGEQSALHRLRHVLPKRMESLVISEILEKLE
jgi:hypothetical protein